ncbi:hypothetical protein MASR1M60_10690 [Rhodocyclaceae bacterium]
MLIFFDTEFTGLIVDAKLISIGLADETGERTFYAELSDTWQEDNELDFFVEETVLPLLEGGVARMTMAELRKRLRDWLEAFGQPVQLATDSLAWDWDWFQKIFHKAGKWPENVDSKPLVLPNSDEVFNHAIEEAFASGLRRHHALDDAEANRRGWLAYCDSRRDRP